MMCACNMPAFIPPVAPSSSAAERFGPSHHTLGRGTLAAMFFLNPSPVKLLWSVRFRKQGLYRDLAVRVSPSTCPGLPVPRFNLAESDAHSFSPGIGHAAGGLDFGTCV